MKADEVKRKMVICEAKRIDLDVERIKVKASGYLTMSDVVNIDGYEPEWIDKVTIVLEIDRLPRVTLEGPMACQEK